MWVMISPVCRPALAAAEFCCTLIHYHPPRRVFQLRSLLNLLVDARYRHPGPYIALIQSVIDVQPSDCYLKCLVFLLAYDTDVNPGVRLLPPIARARAWLSSTGSPSTLVIKSPGIIPPRSAEICGRLRLPMPPVYPPIPDPEPLRRDRRDCSGCSDGFPTSHMIFRPVR